MINVKSCKFSFLGIKKGSLRLLKDPLPENKHNTLRKVMLGNYNKR